MTKTATGKTTKSAQKWWFEVPRVETQGQQQCFYPSVEWDLLGVPAKKNEKYYTCCSEPYPDITLPTHGQELGVALRVMVGARSRPATP